MRIKFEIISDFIDEVIDSDYVNQQLLKDSQEKEALEQLQQHQQQEAVKFIQQAQSKSNWNHIQHQRQTIPTTMMKIQLKRLRLIKLKFNLFNATSYGKRHSQSVQHFQPYNQHENSLRKLSKCFQRK